MMGKTKIVFSLLLVSLALIGMVSACHCGDGIINVQGEECDDGNTIDGDGCSANCNLESLCPLDEGDYDEVIIINEGLRSDTTTSNGKSSIIPVSLEPGRYSVTLVARDNYEGRESVTQPNEQYKLSFIKDSSQVGITPSTTDLQDYVEFAQRNEVVTGDLLLEDGGDSIQAFHHKYSEIQTDSPNSLTAVCVGINKNSGYCGDGILDDGEDCDDGNNVDGDGCTANCNIEECHLNLIKLADKDNSEPGDTVTYTLEYHNLGAGVCTGGGVKIQDVLDENLEYKGSYNHNILNDIDSQGLNSGWYSIPGYDESTNTLTWNAHVVSPNEKGTITFEVEVLEPIQCGDFQIDNYFKAWSDQEGWKNSNTVSLFVDNDCPYCGNGILDDGEDCDWGVLNGFPCDPFYGCSCQWCNNDCELITEEGGYCGDGILDDGEDCDDGNNVDGDGCTANCEIEEEEPFCGDGFKEGEEECDWGILNGLLCWASYGTSCQYCSNSCELITITNYCGDGIKQHCEECDDGNNVDGDGCSSECEIEEEPVCGDCIEEGDEECDWGVENGIPCNPFYGDSCQWCNSNCELITEEGGYCGDGECNGQEDCETCEEDCGECPPEPECGNGIKECGEECDDGNTIDGDGCSANCEIEEDDKYIVKKPIVLKTCDPNWECSGWSECIDGVMTRTCVDDNHCEFEYNKPYETTACDVAKQSKEIVKNNLLWFFLGIVILIVLLIILVNLFR